MAPPIRWQDPIGRRTLNSIVKTVIPAWKNGLRPVQEDLLAPVLDGEDILCCTATGDGKSAAFSVPILVLNEYNRHPKSYPPGLRTRLHPIGLVVMPTKGLASNIVAELAQLNVTALTYCRESLADARRDGVSLADEVMACEKWQVVCVDPEHISGKEWRAIAEHPKFRSRIIYGAVDEVHLIDEWGASKFRVAFKLIGLFLRGCLPSGTSIIALSATLAPGKDTTTVCDTLGLYGQRFYLIRRTNERPNIQFIMQTLLHGLSGYEFPDLLQFLQSGRKTIVHFSSLDMLFRCYVYIWRTQGPSADKLRRTRMYHSLCPASYNEETIRLIDNDPYCQIILATIAFSNGINARSILDSISLGFASSLDIVWQEKGRAGREPGTQARGIVLVQASSIRAASKQISSTDSGNDRPTTTGKRKRKSAPPMDSVKARMLVESHCYVALMNEHYGNPPLETTTLDCIAADWLLPCSLCLARSQKTIDFPAPPSAAILPPLTATLYDTTSTPPKSRSRKLKLTKKECTVASSALIQYRNTLCADQHLAGKNLEHPQILVLPPSLNTTLLDNLLAIKSRTDFDVFVKTWRHREHHSSSLYTLIGKLRNEFNRGRDLASRARKAQRERDQGRGNKRRLDTDDESADETSDEVSNSSLPEAILAPPRPAPKNTGPRKRQALGTVTNVRKARAPVLTVADVAKEYGPGYKTTSRRRAAANEAEETGLRRSSRKRD